jgi:hypothetical protein
MALANSDFAKEMLLCTEMESFLVLVDWQGWNLLPYCQEIKVIDSARSAIASRLNPP